MPPPNPFTPTTTTQDINVTEIESSKFPVHARYSDNAASILKLASNKAMIESKGIVGTEDILWAMYASSHQKSRSRAVERLHDRGMSFDMIFGKVILSDNANLAFQEAIKHAQMKDHKVVGSEDLLWALFQKTKRDSKARYWLSSQRIMVPNDKQIQRTMSSHNNNDNDNDNSNPVYSLPRLFLIGGLAGMAETCVQQPLVYWKTMSQINPSFSILNALQGGIRPLFRGVGVNVTSVGPISAGE